MGKKEKKALRENPSLESIAKIYREAMESGDETRAEFAADTARAVIQSRVALEEARQLAVFSDLL